MVMCCQFVTGVFIILGSEAFMLDQGGPVGPGEKLENFFPQLLIIKPQNFIMYKSHVKIEGMYLSFNPVSVAKEWTQSTTLISIHLQQ